MAEHAFRTLVDRGIEVLYDDRCEANAGVKLKDADLRGRPVRVVIGERSLQVGGAELSVRGHEGSRIVPLPDLPDAIQSEISERMARLTPNSQT